MQEKHTPGPWEIGYLDDKGGAFEIGIGYDDGIVRGNGYVIASRGPVYHKAEEMKANARLIAAAPKLLAALKTLRVDANRLCDRCLGGTYEDDCRTAIAIADEAIARAEGREP